MSRPSSYSQERYLAAKTTVDDRSLHRPTLDRLAVTASSPLRVLEVGAGIGTMFTRLRSWGLLPASGTYTLVDVRTGLLRAARERVAAAAREAGHEVTSLPAERSSDLGIGESLRGLSLSHAAGDTDAGRADESDTEASGEWRVEFVAADARDLAAGTDRTWDLLVAAAFLDLVDLDAVADLLSLVPGGHFYAPITFDGETIFCPARADDAAVIDAFHGAMDAPDRPGGSRTARALLDAVPDAGGTVLAGGGSDWFVAPPYVADEAYFLHHVVDTVERAVTDASADVDPASWADARHADVEAERLTYVAHQLDLFGRVEAAGDE